MKTIIAALSLTAFSATSYAHVYSCKGTYDHKIDFDLKTTKKEVTLSVTHAACKAGLDTSYRPTAKFEGYARFHGKDAVTCRQFMKQMLGEHTLESVKVSPELQAGEDEGEFTMVIDVGDYHGQLANERVHCELQ